MGLGQVGRLVGGGAGIVGGGRQTLVHGIRESLAGCVRLDRATAWRSHCHRALVDHTASVHHGWRDGRGDQWTTALGVIQLACIKKCYTAFLACFVDIMRNLTLRDFRNI